ncbi:MAG: hypothetical protein MUF72_21050 [Elainella sp. Prado103]|nr:hypothetical protein [Elainella sp. Prado103]
MRYSIMLQIVTGMTIILLGAAGLFAWLQNRTPAVKPIGAPSASIAIGSQV